MFTLNVCILAFIVPYNLKAQTLQWDDNAHTSFSLTFEHNVTKTIALNQITYDGVTYELVDDIWVNKTNSLLTTIQAWMLFEEPIDDIKQADDDFDDYRVKQYDFQTITRAKASSLLELIHNGTLEYDRTKTYKHLSRDGTLETVYMKNYPISSSCPGNCLNPSENGFAPTYGGSAGCDEDCIVYLCEYLGEYWGAGSCDPLAQDDDVTVIESEFEAWWAVLEGASLSYRLVLAWGYDDPAASTTYPNRWGLKYLESTGDEIYKQCSDLNVYWDNGHYNGELYSPTAALGNEFRKISYSLKNISVLSHHSIPITIGTYSNSYSTVNADIIKQALSERFSYQRVIIDDVGYHSYGATQSFSNSSSWLFINNTYFGFGCDQIMIDQFTWQSATCGECMNHILSTWSIFEHGITTIPYYDDLDLSNGIVKAVEVVTNLTSHSENGIAINFNYIFPTTSISISSTNFAFKQPNVCNAESRVYILTSTKSSNVSFTNCGEVSADFTYTINCVNGYTSTTFASVTVGINDAKADWTSDVTNSNCDSVSSITISTSSCPEFWDSTCIWSTSLTTITPEPTKSPTDQPTHEPTKSPTGQPTPTPTPQPTVNPTFSPTASPVSFFDSCTAYQVVSVRGAVLNTIVHQELCLPSTRGHYIVDIDARKPYYIVINSGSVSNTTINKINELDYDIGLDSGSAATGSALVGHSMIVIENWYDVLAYLGLDLSTYIPSQPVYTSIKIDGLTLAADVPSETLQNEFKTNLQSQIVLGLELEDGDQITINSVREGSIIADIIISSSLTSAVSPLEINVALQNLIASNEATEASVTSPLNSVNNYYYANQTNSIVFTNCPYRLTATAWEGQTVVVSWDTPSIKTNLDDIRVYQAIGENSGESFSPGSYFIRYVALSSLNTSITPKYCSFVIAVDEEEWVLEFMGVEFSLTTLIIIGTVLFCICTGSIACSVRSRCKATKAKTKRVVAAKQAKGNFKEVIVSHVNNLNVAASPKCQIASAPLLDQNN